MHSGEKENKGLGQKKDNVPAGSRTPDTPVAGGGAVPTSPEEIKKAAAEVERKQLESLMRDLKQAILSSIALAPYKNQLLLDITSEGLRIQIVDDQNRPMFDLGGSKLKDYSRDILKELAKYLDSVPNRISITGHTDETQYTAQNGFNNWDLSTERANAARRALEGGGLTEGKISRVVGLSSSVLFDKQNPRNPVNRRISIIVLTREAEQSALRTDVPVSEQEMNPGEAAGQGAQQGAQLGAPPAGGPAQ
jgi:chemotaxis protein MotB